MSSPAYDHIRIQMAREALDRAQLVDLNDPMSTVRTVGELRAVLGSLLAVVERDHDGGER